MPTTRPKAKENPLSSGKWIYTGSRWIYDPTMPALPDKPVDVATTRRQKGPNSGSGNQDTSTQMDDIIKQWLDYQYPEEELQRRMNLLGQMLSAGQSQAFRGFAQRQAGRTGGRLGSAERGFSDIGGQYAMARAQGTGQIMSEAFNKENQMKLAALQAYIQKYGIDKNAMLMMKQLQQQKDIAESQMWAGIGENLGFGLPWLAKLLNW